MFYEKTDSSLFASVTAREPPAALPGQEMMPCLEEIHSNLNSTEMYTKPISLTVKGRFSLLLVLRF